MRRPERLRSETTVAGAAPLMLYSLYDWQLAAFAPLRTMALAGRDFLTNPDFPFTESRFFRGVAAGCELFERITRRYEKPAWGLERTRTGGASVAVAEEIVEARPHCNLLHFRREADDAAGAAGAAGARGDPKVLVVAPMSGHHATLLRGTVAALLPEHDVYITDWIDAGRVPVSQGRFDLDDYVDHIIAFLQRLGPGAHVIAVCQPSVPVLGAVSLMAADGDPCQPASMTLMGGPVDTRIAPTRVNEFAKRHSLGWFERSVITRVPFGYEGFNRRVYPGFLQLTGFMSMNFDRHFGAHLKLFDHLIRGDGDSAEAHRKFYDEYMSVMDMTAEFYLQTVDTVFQRHALPRGEWVSRGRRIDPPAIAGTALLTVEGELDDISAPGQTRAAHALCSNIPPERRRHILQPQVGHYGIFNGRRWRELIYPQVRDFIRAADAGSGPGRAGA